MDVQKEFGVLKFVERHGQCYVSTHYVVGETLAAWRKRSVEIPKEQLVYFVREMTFLLSQFHKIEGGSSYQYMNPYALIVSKEEDLFLLDIQAEENQDLLKFMQKRAIREQFRPKESMHSQKGNLRRDIYGLGRTYQYFLASVHSEPQLKITEEQKFQKIISKCLSKDSKKQYKNIQEILKQLPRYRSNKIKVRKVKKWLLSFLFIALTCAAFMKIYSKPQKQRPEKIIKKQNAEQKGANIELGLLYLLELQNYSKSLDAFSKSAEESRLAELYISLVNFLWKGDEVDNGNSDIEDVLTEIERRIPEKKDGKYYASLLEGYKLIDSPSATMAKIRIGEYCLSLQEWLNEDGNSDKEKTVRSCLAGAYEESSRKNEAIMQYEKLLDIEDAVEIQSSIVQKLMVIYMDLGELEKALDICARGLELCPSSEELHIMYIRIQCETRELTEEELTNMIAEIKKDVPDILDKESFLKLQREYGIKIEGERAWIER